MGTKGILGQVQLDDLVVVADAGVVRVDAVHRRKLGYHRRETVMAWAWADTVSALPIDEKFMDANFWERISESVYSEGNDGAEVLAKWWSELCGCEFQLLSGGKLRIFDQCGAPTYECSEVHRLQNWLRDRGFGKFANSMVAEKRNI